MTTSEIVHNNPPLRRSQYRYCKAWHFQLSHQLLPTFRPPDGKSLRLRNSFSKCYAVWGRVNLWTQGLHVVMQWRREQKKLPRAGFGGKQKKCSKRCSPGARESVRSVNLAVLHLSNAYLFVCICKCSLGTSSEERIWRGEKRGLFTSPNLRMFAQYAATHRKEPMKTGHHSIAHICSELGLNRVSGTASAAWKICCQLYVAQDYCNYAARNPCLLPIRRLAFQ